MQTNKKPLPQLDARLAAAAAYVRQGGTAADIGCDHGRLSVFLAANQLCKKVIACDLREAPLQQAARNLALHGCMGIAQCRLGDGLSVLAKGEADTIIIAGVSGITICDILTAGIEICLPETRFIFVPTSKHVALRRDLCKMGFAIEAETPVKAAGRYYTVICAAYTGLITAPTPLFCAMGKANAKGNAAASGYLTGVSRRLAKEAQSAAEPQKSELLSLADEVKKEALRCQISVM